MAGDEAAPPPAAEEAPPAAPADGGAPGAGEGGEEKVEDGRLQGWINSDGNQGFFEFGVLEEIWNWGGSAEAG